MIVSDQPTFASQTPVRVASVALAVRDLESVARFYENVLRLERIDQLDEGVRLGVAGAPLLELEHRPEAAPDDPAQAGLFHTAFLMPTRADLARWLARYSELSLPLDGASDHLVSEAIYLSDPEGNGIEVYADRPPETWRWREDGLAMGTYPLDLRDLLSAALPGPSDYAAAPTGMRLGHIHLRVGDLAAAERFYADLLGLRVTVRVPGATFLSSGGYHHHIGANTWRSAGTGLRDPHRAGLARIVLEVHASELLAICERLLTAGVSVSEKNGRVSFQDSWGTHLELIAVDDPGAPA